MVRHGEAPYLECSSKGDKRFSAFSARIRTEGNKSIEELYQAFKVFSDGSTGLSWREAKGKSPVNISDCIVYYNKLWILYLRENPELVEVLVKQTGLSDIFGQTGRQCQATTLWNIVHNLDCLKIKVSEP